jgi:hypothetical protein
MKNLLLILTSITLLTSCFQEGTITDRPESVYEINGKKYKFVELVPSDESRRVWIMIPLDSLENAPEITVSEQNEGNQVGNVSVIKLN